MKILILSDDFPPYALGGAGVMAFRLAKEFVRQGNEVLVISTTREKEKEGVMEFEGLTIHILYANYNERWRSYYSLCNPFLLKKVKIILAEFSPDVVHAHNVHAYISYASLLLAKKYADKVFMTAHDIMSFYPGTFTVFINPEELSCPKFFDYRVTPRMLIRKFRFRYNPFRNTFVLYVLRKIDGVIAVSYELKVALTQNSIPVLGVIHNGIETSGRDVSREQVESFKKDFGFEDSEVVLFGGRLSGAKGGDLILQAMKEVVRCAPLVKLLVVGRKDSYAERMEKKVKSLGLEDKVVFAGWLSEEGMRKAYASAVLVVVPSVCFDSFPNGNIEAFVTARPVVSTCFGGSREIVHDGENGHIVNPFNVPSLADAITDLILNKEKAHKFGEMGRSLVAKKYSINEMAKRYLLLFRE